jgi:ATP-dependent Clp protease adaptor protein ClpS
MATETKESPATSSETRLSPKHHLILLDDDDHSYEYVIEMLTAVFGYGEQKGFQIALEVDASGRAIVFTAHLEVVELKRDQVHAYGADWRIPNCRGSMSAVIESAPS